MVRMRFLVRDSIGADLTGSLQACRAMAVSVIAGLTQLTLMPCRPSSLAMARLIASSAPFEAQ